MRISADDAPENFRWQLKRKFPSWTFLSHNLINHTFSHPIAELATCFSALVLKNMASRTLSRAVRSIPLSRQAISIAPVARRSITHFASRGIFPQTGRKVLPPWETILIVDGPSYYADSRSQDSGLCRNKGRSLWTGRLASREVPGLHPERLFWYQEYFKNDTIALIGYGSQGYGKL